MWYLLVDFYTYYCSTQTSYTLPTSTWSKLIHVKCNVHIISSIFIVINLQTIYQSEMTSSSRLSKLPIIAYEMWEKYNRYIKIKIMLSQNRNYLLN